MEGLLSGVTLEKKPYLCSCKSSELIDAMSLLRSVGDIDLHNILLPYQDSQITVVMQNAKVDEVAGYLGAVKGVEQVFIDYNVIKAFTVDSVDTYLAVQRGESFDMYLAHADTGMMW